MTHTICPDIPPKIVALKILFVVADVEYLVLCMECFYQERFMTPCCICICTQFQSSYKCICICIGVPVSVACSVCARLGPYWVSQHEGHHQSQHEQTMCPLLSKNQSQTLSSISKQSLVSLPKLEVQLCCGNKTKPKYFLSRKASE